MTHTLGAAGGGRLTCSQTHCGQLVREWHLESDKILHQMKLFLKDEGKIKTFLEDRAERDFTAGRSRHDRGGRGRGGEPWRVTPTLSQAGVGTALRGGWRVAVIPMPTLISHGCLHCRSKQGCVAAPNALPRRAADTRAVTGTDVAEGQASHPHRGQLCSRLTVVPDVTPEASPCRRSRHSEALETLSTSR